MAFRMWGGANPTAGGSYGVGEFLQRDPDQMAALDLQRKGQEFGQDLAKANFGLKQDLYGTLKPYLGMLGQFGTVGGATAPQPSISRGPIYSPEQIQQQVNTQTAGNDARYQTLMRQLNQSNAARGFGASSPAMQAQMTQLGISNIGENARTARELPMQYAKANADQTYRTDQLAEQQWGEGQDVDIRRRQTQLQGMNALLSQLAHLA